MIAAVWRFSLLGYPVALAKPEYLLLVGVAALVFVVAFAAGAARRARLARVVSGRLSERVAPGVSRGRPMMQSGLVACALGLFALALAQPQCGAKSELVKRLGVDVVVALDASKSMLAKDVSPTRLDRARLELVTLLEELKGDRVGIVAFAGEAFVQCPLTSDYAAVRLFLKAVDPNQMQQGGTDIGEALVLAKQVLDGADRGGEHDRVVILLSDGEDLGGDARGAASALKDAGIRVFSVGVGSEQGEPIPVLDANGEVTGYKKDREGNTVLTRMDRATLAEIAELTHGGFFHRPQGVAMDEVARQIDQLRKSELESRIAVRYDERFQVFALPGLAFLLVGAALRTSRRSP